LNQGVCGVLFTGNVKKFREKTWAIFGCILGVISGSFVILHTYSIADVSL
jgi:hypothetical protein